MSLAPRRQQESAAPAPSLCKVHPWTPALQEVAVAAMGRFLAELWRQELSLPLAEDTTTVQSPVVAGMVMPDVMAMPDVVAVLTIFSPAGLQRKHQGKGGGLQYLQGGCGRCLHRGKCQGMLLWHTQFNSGRYF